MIFSVGKGKMTMCNSIPQLDVNYNNQSDPSNLLISQPLSYAHQRFRNITLTKVSSINAPKCQVR